MDIQNPVSQNEKKNYSNTKIFIGLASVIAVLICFIFLGCANVKSQQEKQNSEEISSLEENNNGKVSKQELSVTGTINGHEYVDLGLPSGLKWATCNIGALKPEEKGSYFSWSEVDPSSSYSESNCKTYSKDKKWLSKNGYINGEGNLTLPHDAAHKNWGETWRMPTFNEILELANNTTTKFTTYNGVVGCLVFSKLNGNSLFLPITGLRLGSELSLVEDGFYWSSTPHDSNPYASYCFILSEDELMKDNGRRDQGFPVRAVSE